MNFGKNPQHDFQRMRGGGQRSFRIFQKIHPFWYGYRSLRCCVTWNSLTIWVPHSCTMSSSNMINAGSAQFTRSRKIPVEKNVRCWGAGDLDWADPPLTEHWGGDESSQVSSLTAWWDWGWRGVPSSPSPSSSPPGLTNLSSLLPLLLQPPKQVMKEKFSKIRHQRRGICN